MYYCTYIYCNPINKKQVRLITHFFQYGLWIDGNGSFLFLLRFPKEKYLHFMLHLKFTRALHIKFYKADTYAISHIKLSNLVD